MIVNQDKLFSIYVTMLRTIWTKTRPNLADSNDFDTKKRELNSTRQKVFTPGLKLESPDS